MTLMLAGPILMRLPVREARRRSFQSAEAGRYSFPAKHSTVGETWGRSRRRWRAVWRWRALFLQGLESGSAASYPSVAAKLNSGKERLPLPAVCKIGARRCNHATTHCGPDRPFDRPDGHTDSHGDVGRVCMERE